LQGELERAASRSSCGLKTEETHLEIESAAESPETVGGQNAMAGNHDEHGIPPAGSSDRSRGARTAREPGEFAVGRRTPVRNAGEETVDGMNERSRRERTDYRANRARRPRKILMEALDDLPERAGVNFHIGAPCCAKVMDESVERGMDADREERIFLSCHHERAERCPDFRGERPFRRPG
jgi:hypothetical protein